MTRFNVRVYGLYQEQGRVLMCREKIAGTEILKFPGGGLEFGEGTIDCVKREWMEELECEIEALGHFYTTDYFQPSAFDDSQVISIYYLVKPAIHLQLPVINNREYFFFADLNEDLLAQTSLPIDKIVVRMLLDQWTK